MEEEIWRSRDEEPRWHDGRKRTITMEKTDPPGNSIFVKRGGYQEWKLVQEAKRRLDLEKAQEVIRAQEAIERAQEAATMAQKNNVRKVGKPRSLRRFLRKALLFVLLILFAALALFGGVAAAAIVIRLIRDAAAAGVRRHLPMINILGLPE